MNKIVIINKKLCVACEECVYLCPQNILFVDKNANACKVSNELLCDRLRGCEDICEVKAITIK